MKDVVADIKCFLEGSNPYPTEAEMLEAETSKWMDDAHDYVPDSVVKRGVIYIAGPMRGYKNLNLKAFFDAEKKLKKDGWVVINPAKNPPGMSLDAYVAIDIASIMACDAIFMLKGWKESTGAMAELSVAKWRKIEIINEEEYGTKRIY